jgi:hypothetical protein
MRRHAFYFMKAEVFFLRELVLREALAAGDG